MYPFIPIGSLFQIPTYFLIISLGCIFSSLWFIHRAQKASLNTTTAVDLTILVLVVGFLGARILHIIYESPEFYRQNWLRVFHVWNGGFVFYGGVISGIVAASVFCSIQRQPFWFWADIATLPVSLAYALGRLACFFNGCCFGKFCEWPWAIYVHGSYRHPTQLYASGFELCVLAFLLFWQKRFRPVGLLFNIWLILHSIGRIFMELFRADPRGDLIDIGVGTVSLGIFLSWTLILFAIVNIVNHQVSLPREQ